MSLGKQEILKNAIDKVMGILPTKIHELETDTDDNGKEISGTYCQYWVWETSDKSIELSYHFTDDKNIMRVELYYTLK